MMHSIQHPVFFTVQGLRLSGILHLPENEPIAAVVGCHGLLSDKRSPKQLELARGCTAMEMAYFRFDHRGCGQSEGVFETDTTLEARRADLIGAVGAVNQTLGKKVPVGLFGSSLGGTVSLSAAGDLCPFAMVTLAAPVHNRSIHFPKKMPSALKNDLIRHRLTFNISTALETIHHILVIHGDSDETVPVENAHLIFHKACNPKCQLILDGADHRIGSAVHQKRFVAAALNWFADCYADTYGWIDRKGSSRLDEIN